MSVSRGNDVDIYLNSQSCSTAVSADSSSDSESGASDSRDCTPYVTGIISSSFLGTQQKVYSWCQDKYRGVEKSNGAFSCKLKGCDMKELTLSNYTSHLSNYHGAASSFVCPFCPREFCSLKYLNKHARKDHRKTQCENEVLVDDTNSDSTDYLEKVLSSPKDVEIREESDLIERISRLIDGSAGQNVLLSMLGDTSATWSQAFRYIGATKNFTEDIMKTVNLCLGLISSECPDVLASHCFRSLLKASGEFTFCSPENEYQVLKLLKQKRQFVMLSDLVFGVEHEIRSVKGQSVFKQIERTGQFVSISKVLQNTIFYHDEIFAVMGTYSCLLEGLSKVGVILDGMQTVGKLSFPYTSNKSTYLSDVDFVIQQSCSDDITNLSLQLYFDEIEPVNLIGSRTSSHKIGCFYWCLKNLPPWYLSDMRMTHLVALVPYLDIETYGFKEVLTAIKGDLVGLEKGIEVKTRTGKTLSVALRRLNFVADNMAYHAVFGFDKSFSGGFCCEKCTVPQSSFKSVFEERLQDLRSSQSCREDAVNKRNGIKHLCVLETFYFDPHENFTADLHHDIFQGSLMNILRIVLNELTPDYLSLDSLNLRINNFAYGRDINGKPSEIDFERIKDKSQGHFKQKYDQMLTLYRFLPLMIFDAVPFNKIWKFLLDFFDLISFLLSPTFVESDYQLLGVLIRELLRLILFTDFKVICVFFCCFR